MAAYSWVPHGGSGPGIRAAIAGRSSRRRSATRRFPPWHRIIRHRARWLRTRHGTVGRASRWPIPSGCASVQRPGQRSQGARRSTSAAGGDSSPGCRASRRLRASPDADRRTVARRGGSLCRGRCRRQSQYPTVRTPVAGTDVCAARHRDRQCRQPGPGWFTRPLPAGCELTGPLRQGVSACPRAQCCSAGCPPSVTCTR